jgi:hypothetical protein
MANGKLQHVASGSAFGYFIPKFDSMTKLTLRDLFAVVTIVALALGWAADRGQLKTQYAGGMQSLEMKIERRDEQIEVLETALDHCRRDQPSPSN